MMGTECVFDETDNVSDYTLHNTIAIEQLFPQAF